MNTGVIQGGWEFVWAAYAVSATVLIGYALSVYSRYRAAAAPPRPPRAQTAVRRSSRGALDRDPGAGRLLAPRLLTITVGGIGKNLVYYWGPTELHAAGDKAVGATIRLGGPGGGRLHRARRGRVRTSSST